MTEGSRTSVGVEKRGDEWFVTKIVNNLQMPDEGPFRTIKEAEKAAAKARSDVGLIL